MFSRLLACCVLLAAPIASQSITSIYDIWQTTWNRDALFTYTNLSPNPIPWKTPGSSGQANIVIDDSTKYQEMIGFGASLSDSAAEVLNNLKSTNSQNYWDILGHMFDSQDGHDAAGVSYLRVPIGASDFSTKVYSFDDTSGDTSLSKFNINNAPSYLFSVLQDIQSINSAIRIHIVPWSPPGWMKDSGTMKGGSFLNQYTDAYANYLLKTLQGFKSNGINVWAIGIQNEPQNSNPSYPTCKISASQEAQIGLSLRSLMNNNGFSNVILIGYEHNWDDAAQYPEQLVQQASSAFEGVAFHCYGGNVSQQATFEKAYPSKSVYLTECTGSQGSDWWSDIKWYTDNIYIGAPNYGAKTAAMWNLALDGNGKPMLPGTSSCNPPCRPIVTVNSDGSYSYNQEFYVMAQASKAILPKDNGGPFGQRIKTTISGSLNWGLVVSGYVTERSSSSDWNRYSLVVLNWDDQPNGSWDPTPIKTTIEFRGYQATYTFPVGLTTLIWYAPS